MFFTGGWEWSWGWELKSSFEKTTSCSVHLSIWQMAEFTTMLLNQAEFDPQVVITQEATDQKPAE